jgi:small-conductance mechanosensitive channel
MNDSLGQMRGWLDIPLFNLGSTPITLWTIVLAVILTIALFVFNGFVKRRVLTRVLSRTQLAASAQSAITTLLGYLIISIGLLVILQTVGINLTTLNVLAGAIGIGVGFGLQNIANNFISGLIILAERPIKVGDRVEVGNVTGRVEHIRARSTTVLTNDNIAIIVPNSSFISENVVNWSYSDESVRFHIPVGVAYGSDTRKVESLLLDVARKNINVLDSPKPAVRFEGFGDSSLDFELLVWTSAYTHRRGALKSELNFAIEEAFRTNGVEIPFPQRDVHFRTPIPAAE